ncbi:hypothetical protein Lser_V15G19119 [Lactuca serriola]
MEVLLITGLVSTSQELFQMVLLTVFVISCSKCAKNLACLFCKTRSGQEGFKAHVYSHFSWKLI